jgi:hypothetical protein
MSDLILNANDPNFKSLLSKLIACGWIEKISDTARSSTAKRNIEIQWTKKGQLCLLTIKMQHHQSPFWKVASSFVASLNEQEEAFFQANMLSGLPDKPL